ncbi:helix-turn-helix domain-containing protein [Nocardia terpenica]|uniref:XRE family transcriptional regulator n=1 Tax=Nocardia terpenica TaxID=455432 RepID=A0A291RG41_9NOCA|nr:helix-turn-helix transcriptional regulator [Nocardia terpenica]ATL66270.1 XRE family transcriptional regulator [Nocardia terpenica]
MAGYTLTGRALGRLLCKYRERAKLTKHAAAQYIETSQQTLGRIEDGLKSKVPDMVVNVLCDAYKVSNAERKELLGLARELRTAKNSGGTWWRAYLDQMAEDFDHYLALEQAASKLTTHQLSLLPGLVQIADYRRGTVWEAYPTLPHEEIERRIELVMKRQARLDDPSFQLDVILSEAALRHVVGSPAVMHDQCEHLLRVGERPNVSLRIVPLHARSCIGAIAGSFVFLEFPPLPSTKLIEPPVVYVEEFTGALYLVRDGEIQRYRAAADRISRVALDAAGTRDLVMTIAEEYAQ